MFSFVFLKAAFLGLIEGMTEFLPVSSTGHLILAGHLINFHSPGETFTVLVQLGAICALFWYYRYFLLRLAAGIFSDPTSRRICLGIFLASVPAFILGFTFHRLIKEVLFNPLFVCFALVIGGVILWWIDRKKITFCYATVENLPLKIYVYIGLFQCLALVPGVSRSGATIVGGMLLGTDKKTAMQVSFLLAMPVLLGAFVFDLYKNYSLLRMEDGIAITIGFFSAFVAGYAVLSLCFAWISRYGFMPFALWRMMLGGIGIVYFIFA